MIKITIPLHVSGLWVPKLNPDPLESGSVGVGLNLAVHIKAEVDIYNKGFGVYLGNERVLSKHSEYVSRRNGMLAKVNARAPFSLGAGFGMSAALTIAYSLATCPNRGFIEDCLDVAHEAEVLFKTGLGDVVAEVNGGFLMRLKAGSPTRAKAKRIVVKDKPTIIVCEVSGVGVDTPTMLDSINPNEYLLAENLLAKLLEDPALERFFQYAQMFTRRLFDYRAVDEALRPFISSTLGYYMKKKALLIWVDEGRVEEVLFSLNNRGFKCIESTISNTGVTIEYTAKPPA